jgi:intracellular septation protein A
MGRVQACRYDPVDAMTPFGSRSTSGVGGVGVVQAEASGHHVLHLPSPRAFVRHALPSLIESTIGPAVLFYLVLVTAGFRGALIAALAWSYLAAGRRLVRRQRVSGMLLLGLLLISLRTLVAFATGSAFLYFVQPTAGTFLVAVIFLVTAMARRPLIERLAHDFCPLDPELFKRDFLRRFFLRVSLLWAVVLTTQAGFVLMLLLRSSLRAFVIERTLVSGVLTAGGITLSVLWFVRSMRQHGIAVRFNSALNLAHVPSGPGPVTLVDEQLLG